MSSSTVAIANQPTDRGQSTYKSQKFEEPKSTALLVSSLWLFSAIHSAAKPEFMSGTTGISVTFNMQDVVLIAFAAWMLHKGLSTRNFALIVPWIVVTVYGIYYNHYKSLVQMLIVLRTTRHLTVLPWLAVSISFIGLVLRVILIIRTLQLSTNLWYRKKLEKELYKTLS